MKALLVIGLCALSFVVPFQVNTTATGQTVETAAETSAPADYQIASDLDLETGHA